MLGKVLAVVCILFSVVLAEPLAPAPPNISAIFSAVVNAKGFNGNFYYNSELGAYALTATETYFGDYSRFEVTLFSYYANYFILNNVCRINLNPKAKYSDLFSWITDKPYYLGTKFYKGSRVEVWANEPTDEAKYLLYAIGQDPVFFRFPIWSTDSSQPFPISLDFVEYIPGPFDSSILRPPSQCFGQGFTCQGSVQVIDVYRFHNKGDYNLTDTDGADTLGEVAYLCSALQKPYNASSISHFQVSTNTNFGQYALCNNGVCLGLNLNSVGQQASYGVKWNGGQCFSNTDVGNWYSFPHGGRCSGKQDPSTRTCNWKIQSRVKTIDVKCLLSYQFLSACGTHSGSPYYNAALKVFNQSFSKCASIKVADEDSYLL